MHESQSLVNKKVNLSEVPESDAKLCSPIDCQRFNTAISLTLSEMWTINGMARFA